MRDEPQALYSTLLLEKLKQHWGLETVRLQYVPRGAGSYHWQATSGSEGWFVTADDTDHLVTNEGFDGLNAAYETAKALRRDGLEFVVAPVQDVFRIGSWVVALFPLVEGVSGQFGVWDSTATQSAAARCVARLHVAAVPQSIRRFDFYVPHRRALEEALSDVQTPWPGPYGEPLRALLTDRRSRVEAMLREYDSLAADVASLDDAWVVTHGEPHSGNFIASPDGAMHIVDWDTVRLGPRERDLAILLKGDEGGEALRAYRDVAGGIEPREVVMRFFRARWVLADVCAYVERFRRDHTGSEDDARFFAGLSKDLST